MKNMSSRETKMPFFSSKSSRRYSVLRTSDDAPHSIADAEVIERAQHPKVWSTTQVLVLLGVAVAFSSISAYTLGAYHRISTTGDALLVPPGDVSYPMIYNITFTLAPSLESNTAWDAMFPKGVGFVKHPEISPEASGLAVFHELHCVNILRVGYYAALDGSIEEMQHVHDHNKRPDPHHLRHCFDYLRQSLICAADTNLEPVDLELGGVTGWRFERKCRDFQAVKDWAERNWYWPELPK